MAFFHFDGDDDSIAFPNRIHLALKTKLQRLQRKRRELSFLQLLMDAPTLKHCGIRDPQLLHFFQVKQPLAVRERMQSHHPQGRPLIQSRLNR
jgi:hypothetical protein